MFLALVHLHALDCRDCGESIATEGSRSIIVDERDDPLAFSTTEQPEELRVFLKCPQGHQCELEVPLNISVENVEMTPDDANLAGDAYLIA